MRLSKVHVGTPYGIACNRFVIEPVLAEFRDEVTCAACARHTDRGRLPERPADPDYDRGLARHALGLPNDRGVSYRNHFVAGPGHDDYRAWMRMVEAGFARRNPGNAITGGDDVFKLNDVGAKRALAFGERLERNAFRR